MLRMEHGLFPAWSCAAGISGGLVRIRKVVSMMLCPPAALGVAVERREMVAQFTEVEEAINAAQQVAARDVIVEME